jgi:replication factor C subunit 3/5
MLLIDKYLNSDTSVYLHNNLIEKLIKLFTSNSILNYSDNEIVKIKQFDNLQHLILYGNEGCGKNYIVRKLLEELYGKEYIKLENVEYTINGYSNSKVKVEIKQSKYHIIIQPNSNGFDKYLIQEVIHDYVKQDFLNVQLSKKLFKIVVIDKIDDLSYYAQASLRRTMEKYSESCKFIFISNNLSKIIEPLRSRCLQIRVPTLSNIDLTNIILTIGKKEDIDLNILDLKKILKRSNKNIYILIWLLELKKNNVPYKNTWKNIITKILNLILDKNNNTEIGLKNFIKNFRECFYILYITNIKFDKIITELLEGLLKSIENYELKYKIIKLVSDTELRILHGTRYLIHLENFTLKLIHLLNKNNYYDK